jgi:hypothetical protein
LSYAYICSAEIIPYCKYKRDEHSEARYRRSGFSDTSPGNVPPPCIAANFRKEEMLQEVQKGETLQELPRAVKNCRECLSLAAKN